MRDTIEIGPTPANEDCAQVGSEGYGVRAYAECEQFRKAIIRTLGAPPEGAKLNVKGNAHDYGTYYEVAVTYDTDNEAACDYAFLCESKAPTEWTEEDKIALESLEEVRIVCSNTLKP